MSSPSQGISLNIQNGEMRLRTKKLYDYLYSNVIKGLVLISAFMFTISFLLITEKEEIILIKVSKIVFMVINIKKKSNLNFFKDQFLYYLMKLMKIIKKAPLLIMFQLVKLYMDF